MADLKSILQRNGNSSQFTTLMFWRWLRNILLLLLARKQTPMSLTVGLQLRSRGFVSALYAASIFYGYFLKSASLRYHRERGLDLTNPEFGTDAYCQFPLSELLSLGSQYVAFGRISCPRSTSIGQVSCSLGKQHEKLMCYVMGFEPETLQMCAKPMSKEAVNLIERHSSVLFGDENTGLLETDELISTSYASLKRFVLEAVAFGSFL